MACHQSSHSDCESENQAQKPRRVPSPGSSGKETLLRLFWKITLKPESWPLQFPLGLSLVPRRMAITPGDTRPSGLGVLASTHHLTHGTGALPVLPLLQNLHGVQALRFLDWADPALFLLQLQDGRGLPRGRLRYGGSGHGSRGRWRCSGAKPVSANHITQERKNYKRDQIGQS